MQHRPNRRSGCVTEVLAARVDRRKRVRQVDSRRGINDQLIDPILARQTLLDKREAGLVESGLEIELTVGQVPEALFGTQKTVERNRVIVGGVIGVLGKQAKHVLAGSRWCNDVASDTRRRMRAKVMILHRDVCERGESRADVHVFRVFDGDRKRAIGERLDSPNINPKVVLRDLRNQDTLFGQSFAILVPGSQIERVDGVRAL